MKRKAFIISLLTFFCITTKAQQIEIFEPSMMEVEYNKKMVRDTLNRENDFISEAVRLRIGKNIPIPLIITSPLSNRPDT